MRETTILEKAVCEYLNDLRNTGKVNMLGASTYIAEAFDLDRKESRRMLKLWMDNFNNENDYKTVKA